MADAYKRVPRSCFLRACYRVPRLSELQEAVRRWRASGGRAAAGEDVDVGAVFRRT